MRSRIGTVELDSLFHERKKLNEELVASVSGAAAKWGLEVGFFFDFFFDSF